MIFMNVTYNKGVQRLSLDSASTVSNCYYLYTNTPEKN
jgi:hypothetical protein